MSGSQKLPGSPGASMISQGPPYAPRNQGLGGNPEVIPDVPIAAVFLVLYLVFGVIHIKIFKANKGRGHKFIFNGAILGLCKIRVITMSLRIAWACDPRNVGLGIAANVFVYVGTIILFMINWFFVQRVVRAQHQRLGWSAPYRVFHRAALVVLVITLIMIIMASIWQFFTISSTELRVFRALQLTGQTYFTVFCFAPAVLVLISVLLPRTEIEKFGAGRLRVNITILLIAVTVLTTGQLFRCVIAWIPQTPVFDTVGQPVAQPWYLHKACFYVFNFITEIIVVIMFALVRIDLRFHVPNGSRMSGDYSGRNSRMSINITYNADSHFNPSHSVNKKSLPCEAPIVPMMQHNVSSDTLHKYEKSIFEDSNTLADSLQYTGSTLEVDNKTGNWKVKRLSGTPTSSRGSMNSLSNSLARSSYNDRNVTFADNAPPVPQVPSEWPLRISQLPPSPMLTTEHGSSISRKDTAKKTFGIANHDLHGVDVGDKINDTLIALEQNSEKNCDYAPMKTQQKSKEKISALPKPDNTDKIKPPKLPRNSKKSNTSKNPLAPRHRAPLSPKSVLKPSTKHASTHTTPSDTPIISEVPYQTPLITRLSARRPSSVELITLSRKPSTDARKIIDMSLQGDNASDVSRPASSKNAIPSEGVVGACASLSAYSDGTMSLGSKRAVGRRE